MIQIETFRNVDAEAPPARAFVSHARTGKLVMPFFGPTEAETTAAAAAWVATERAKVVDRERQARARLGRARRSASPQEGMSA